MTRDLLTSNAAPGSSPDEISATRVSREALRLGPNLPSIHKDNKLDRIEHRGVLRQTRVAMYSLTLLQFLTDSEIP
jgi:hypothetical protein